jgi:hypothetical protein
MADGGGVHSPTLPGTLLTASPAITNRPRCPTIRTCPTPRTDPRRGQRVRQQVPGLAPRGQLVEHIGFQAAVQDVGHEIPQVDTGAHPPALHVVGHSGTASRIAVNTLTSEP